MSKRPILVLPDPVLRKVADPVDSVDDRVRTLIDDMLETMYAAPGIGLAAPQVGALERVLVCDVSHNDEEKRPLALVNPEITWQSEEMSVHNEGCLSIPEYYEEVERPAQVSIRYLDREGRTQVIDADGILATCLQHEIDHLNGVLFIDYLSRLKRDRITKKFAKQARYADSKSKILA
ncbi:peptide deformylase [Amorphus sp. 3PC139-8]|uniref:peptide deformylase n=1 Tax=Amorphus sp. 3PC139-8 TaxID=2735676 RepID=UPI00345C76C4